MNIFELISNPSSQIAMVVAILIVVFFIVLTTKSRSASPRVENDTASLLGSNVVWEKIRKESLEASRLNQPYTLGYDVMNVGLKYATQERLNIEESDDVRNR